MRRALTAAGFALALLVVCGSAAPASRVLFYQPQRADQALPEARWPVLFARVRAMGFDTLAVQWVAYGDAFATGRERAWLARRLREARAAHLRLVLGLGADPAYFRRQQVPLDGLRGYLQRLQRIDLALARSWRAQLGDRAIDGWYLASEIDDQRWRDRRARAVLLAHLAREKRALQDVQPVPVYLSSFFTGHMTPANYAHLLAQIRRAGVRVWVQDGAGTAQLNAAERDLYLAPLRRCRPPVAAGIVHELFRQVAGQATFAARPMDPQDLREALARQAPCGGDSVYFEMRYLPGMRAIGGDGHRAAGSGSRSGSARP